MERLLGAANVDESLLQDGAEEVLLAAKVVVDHALVGLRPVGDGVDSCPGEAGSCEFLAGGLEDAGLGRLGVALAGAGCCAGTFDRLDGRRLARLGRHLSRMIRIRHALSPGKDPNRTVARVRRSTLRKPPAQAILIHYPVSYS